MTELVNQLKERGRLSTHGSRKSKQSSQRSGKKLSKRSKSKIHLDPNRQVNLLDSSGLSDAIEANLNESLHGNNLLKNGKRPNMLDGDDGPDPHLLTGKTS